MKTKQQILRFYNQLSPNDPHCASTLARIREQIHQEIAWDIDVEFCYYLCLKENIDVDQFLKTNSQTLTYFLSSTGSLLRESQLRRFNKQNDIFIEIGPRLVGSTENGGINLLQRENLLYY